MAQPAVAGSRIDRTWTVVLRQLSHRDSHFVPLSRPFVGGTIGPISRGFHEPSAHRGCLDKGAPKRRNCPRNFDHFCLGRPNVGFVPGRMVLKRRTNQLNRTARSKIGILKQAQELHFVRKNDRRINRKTPSLLRQRHTIAQQAHLTHEQIVASIRQSKRHCDICWTKSLVWGGAKLRGVMRHAQSWTIHP